MSNFRSEHAYWEFAKTVRTERRFIFDGKAGDFLAAVRAASKSRARRVKSGSCLYRVQIGSEHDPDPRETGIFEHPLPKTRLIPDPKSIKNGGRANPSGLAYLYLANTKETALAEMRPWLGESLTLAIFKIQKGVKLVVCRAGSENSGGSLFEENTSTEQIDRCVWNDISRAFSRAVTREDQESAYLPTQILAEAFKAEGFDGVAYRSGLERGTNIVLFDVGVAKLIHRVVYALKKVRYDFEAVLPYALYNKKDGGLQQVGEIHTESP